MKEILTDFSRITRQILNTFLKDDDLKKIYNLKVYGEREIVKDWLIFLSHHLFDVKYYRRIKHNRLFIKPKRLSKIEREILKKYDFCLPIVDTKTIASYLPDILMLAEIIPQPEYRKPEYRRNNHIFLTDTVSVNPPAADIMRRLGPCKPTAIYNYLHTIPDEIINNPAFLTKLSQINY